MKTELSFKSWALSLVEVLVVLAVVGIVVAIGIPSITSIRDTTKQSAAVTRTTAIKNAYEIVKVFNNATKAGVNWSLLKTRKNILLGIRYGMEPEQGEQKGEEFIGPDILSSAFTEATKYLGLNDKMQLVVDESGKEEPIEL